MTIRYRKKPVVIEAVQFGYNEYAAPSMTFNGPIPEWLKQATINGVVSPEFKSEDYWYLRIETLEGPLYASPDDWIVRGVHGELYPVKPDIFEATYEPADPADTATELTRHDQDHGMYEEGK